MSRRDLPDWYTRGHTFTQTRALRRAVAEELDREDEFGPATHRKLRVLADTMEGVPWHDVPSVSAASAACFARMVREAAREMDTGHE